MTREDAKKLLNKLYARADITDEYGDMEDMEPYEKAVDMAVKALEQQPCDDAISRQAVLNLFGKSCIYSWEMSWIKRKIEEMPSISCSENLNRCEDAISRQEAIDAMATWDWQELYLPIQFKELLDELPNVSVKEKTGRWIDDEFGSKCSCCGIHTHLDKFDRPMKFRHCSMCGAKMVDPQESEVQYEDCD